MVGTKHAAETAEAGNDLIGNEQNIVAIKNGLNLLPIASRWRNDTTGAQNRFTNEGSNRIRTFCKDHFFELVSTMLRELFFTHRAVCATEIIRGFRMQDRRARQIECIMEGCKTRHTSRHHA